jgi:trk system potassium uptake protein TrkH
MLLQLGGIGFGASATFLFWLVGRNISLSDRLQLSSMFPGTSAHRIARMAGFITLLSLGIQAVGALFLFVQWVNRYPADQAFFFSLFHSAAAFCNAGFDLFGSVGAPGVSLGLDRHNPFVIFPLAALALLGGLGFPVLYELESRRRERRIPSPKGRAVRPPLSLHARLALFSHLGLFVFSILLFFLLEFRNPATLGSQPLGNQIIDATALSANARSNGFATFSPLALAPSSLLILLMLMFIGTASAGTGGGIKVNTVATLFASVVATVSGRRRPQLFKRSLSQDSVNQALVVLMVFPALLALGLFLLSITDGGIALDRLMFEVVSAFATVGLSLDVTPRLSEWGRIIIELLMFIGRLGPLTLVILLAAREHPSSVTYAEEPVLVG